MIARMITCRELASNGDDLKRMEKLFSTLQQTATLTSLLLPPDEEGAKGGHHRIVHHALHLRRDKEARGAHR